jgi:hypothetical protein
MIEGQTNFYTKNSLQPNYNWVGVLEFLQV